MTYRGHIKNGVVVLDEPAQLPEGSEVVVQAVEPAATPEEIFGQVIGKATGLPADGSTQHDHYIYGTSHR